MGKQTKFSLKWGLAAIVTACWLVPMVLMISAIAYYLHNNVVQQFDDAIITSATTASQISRRSFQTAVTASRDASYDREIRNAWLEYGQKGNRQKLYDRTTTYLRQQYQYDQNFLTAILFFIEEPGTLYYTFNQTPDSSYNRVLDYQREAHLPVMVISESLDTGIFFYTAGDNVYMIRNLVDSSFQPYAVLVTELNTRVMLGSFENIAWVNAATVYLNGTPVMIPEKGERQLLEPPDFYLYPGEVAAVSDQRVTRVYGRETTDAVEIVYVIESDRLAYLGEFSALTQALTLLILLLIPLLILAIWFFYQHIFSPIKQLEAAAQILQEGELGYTVGPGAKNREFAYLTQTFDGMSLRLKEQFDRIYSEELALRDARIMALQSQINPHFLNNTLEIINWEARMEHTDKVSGMIEALSTMLDAAMDRKNKPLVSLSQEMAYVDAYLYIISERFGRRLTVAKEIDPQLTSNQLPRLIMQPMIENAVEHGVTREYTLSIIIRARRREDRMIMEVENNKAMSPKDREAVERLLSPDYDPRGEGSLHLGIHNVNSRLQMIYGEASRLSIWSDGSRTISSFSIPLTAGETDPPLEESFLPPHQAEE